MKTRLVAAASVLLLTAGLLTGCSEESAPAGTATPTEAAPSQEPAPEPTMPEPSEEPTDPAPDASQEPGEKAPDPADFPGEAIDIYPYQGAELMVIGVAAADVLSVRSGPAQDYASLTELDPEADGIVATGNNRLVDETGLWVEVEAAGVTGWANFNFLAHPGAVNDVSAELETMFVGKDVVELGKQVVDARVGGGEDPTPVVTVVHQELLGDLPTVTLDVQQLGDDSLAGLRLRVFTMEAPEGAYAVRTVEEQWLCLRGADEEGFCL